MSISFLSFLIVLTIFWLVMLTAANFVDLKKFGVYVSPLFILLKIDKLGDLAFWIGERLEKPLKKAERTITALGLAIFIALPISLIVNLFISKAPILSAVPITALTLENLLLFGTSLFIALIVHEIAHATIAFAMGEEVETIGIGILGFFAVAFTQFPKASFPSIPRRTKTIIIIGGILANLLMVTFIIPIAVFSDQITAIGYEKRPGALVIAVYPLGPAEKANITSGTVITGISTLFGQIRTNSEIITTYYDLINYLRQTPPESLIELTTNFGNFVLTTAQNKLFPNGSTIGATVYHHYVGKITGAVSVTPFYFTLFVQWLLNVNLFLAFYNFLPVPFSDGQKLLDTIFPTLGKQRKRLIYAISAILLVANLSQTVPPL
ncbi:MAG: hypothetical protein D6732_01435 [Methanobacteriota archaeon]|nr:MAG: hypothetical protein D6732_01435 [Euryarchaeota archaeon]